MATAPGRRPASSRVWAAVAATFVAATALVACGDRDDGGAGSTAQQATTTTTSGESPPTTESAVGGCEPVADGGAIGDLPTVREDRTVVDPSRPTEPGPQLADRAAPTRTLPLVVIRPATGGPYPLVVYSHGLGSAGTERNDTLERWASAGYVVVAPTFPLSSRSRDASDLRNQPTDVAFVTDQIRAASVVEADDLHGAVQPDCVALVGHSLGGGTTMAAAYDTCCTRIAPRAIVDIAGVLVADTAGGRLDAMDPLPVLLVHGTADATVSYSQTEQKAALLHGPSWWLTFPGGAHSDMFVPPRSEVLDASVVSFLDAQLRGDDTALQALPEVVDASGLATLQVLPAR